MLSSSDAKRYFACSVIAANSGLRGTSLSSSALAAKLPSTNPRRFAQTPPMEFWLGTVGNRHYPVGKRRGDPWRSLLAAGPASRLADTCPSSRPGGECQVTLPRGHEQEGFRRRFSHCPGQYAQLRRNGASYSHSLLRRPFSRRRSSYKASEGKMRDRGYIPRRGFAGREHHLKAPGRTRREGRHSRSRSHQSSDRFGALRAKDART